MTRNQAFRQTSPFLGMHGTPICVLYSLRAHSRNCPELQAKGLLLAPFSSKRDLWNSDAFAGQHVQEMRGKFCRVNALSPWNALLPHSVFSVRLAHCALSHWPHLASATRLFQQLLSVFYYSYCYTQSGMFIFIYGCLPLGPSALHVNKANICWAFTMSQTLF